MKLRISAPKGSLVFAFVLLVSSGCANVFGTPLPVAPSDATGSFAAYASPATVANTGTNDNPSFSCPVLPNVLPNFDQNLNGTDRFTVCQNPQTPDTIEIHGTTNSSSTICVWPVNYINPQEIQLSSGANGTTYQCYQVSGPVYASFPNVTYNAVFIVEAPSFQAMQTCLQAQNYFLCPDYSFGQFR